jgi:hypothetical protein
VEKATDERPTEKGAAEFPPAGFGAKFSEIERSDAGQKAKDKGEKIGNHGKSSRLPKPGNTNWRGAGLFDPCGSTTVFAVVGLEASAPGDCFMGIDALA